MGVLNCTDGMYLPFITSAVPQLSKFYDSECIVHVFIHSASVYCLCTCVEWMLSVLPPCSSCHVEYPWLSDAYA